jgi:hypothetical protein
VFPAPTDFPAHLIGVADELHAAITLPVDDPALLPPVRPRAADLEAWQTDLRDYGKTRPLDPRNMTADGYRLVTTFDPDWPLVAQWKPLPRPVSLIIGDPSRIVDEVTTMADGSQRRVRAGAGEVDPWLGQTVDCVAAYVGLFTQRRVQYASAKALLGSAAKGMSSDHRKAWGDVRFHAKAQVEVLPTIIGIITAELYAVIAANKVLTARTR